ncbi:unnamed protein product [Taenia asiatica]|uniref:Pilin_N domain-containing protein n=1 Tax=Taenia asiatica TaxID=60517 RepID=A0A0R3W0F0_TAEAS|nr:unnamed protein product [Taenia asiatica]
MGRGKDVLGGCFRAHALLCGVLAVVLIVISVAFIITGAVLIVKYPNGSIDFDEYLDDWYEQYE